MNYSIIDRFRNQKSSTTIVNDEQRRLLIVNFARFLSAFYLDLPLIVHRSSTHLIVDDNEELPQLFVWPQHLSDGLIVIFQLILLI